MFNRGEEGKARMEGGGHDKEGASSKFNTKIILKIDTLFMIKMAKIDTIFMTKTAEKPYPLGPHIPI